MSSSPPLVICGLAAALCAPAPAQDNPSIADLQAQLDALTLDFENLLLQDVMPAPGESVHGLSPAASKVYNVRSGISIGGYGDARYRHFASPRDDEFDLLRAGLSFCHKFNETWVLNTTSALGHARAWDDRCRVRAWRARAAAGESGA